jgi:hypothetical protein
MYTKSTHPGNMPIRVLQFNILNKFESEGLKSIPTFNHALTNGLVSPGIKYEIDKNALKSPFASCSTKQINIQEVFLSFMWSLSYSLFIIIEKGVQERVTKPEWKGEIIFDTDLLIKANLLLDWALTLNVFYSDWDLSLPNPEQPNNPEEQFYCEKNNGLFENSTCYILFHEYAHLALNHCQYSSLIAKFKNGEVLTPEEIKLLKQLEEDADDFAFNSLVTGKETEQEKFHKGVAIILAHCAMLFMVHNPKKLKKTTHPDTDIRLENAIKKLHLNDALSEDYIWTLGCLACMKFSNIHNVILNITPKDPKPLFKDYMSEFDRLKI